MSKHYDGQLDRLLDGSNPELRKHSSILNARSLLLKPSSTPVSDGLFRDSHDRLQRFMQGSKDGFWDWDIVGNECYVSARWKELRGYAPNSIIADPIALWRENLHPDDRDRVVQAVEHHLMGRTPFLREEYRIRHQNGSYIWILDRGQAVWDETGNAIRMAGSQTDITELKTTEAALRESEIVYKTLANTMPQIVWMTTPEGTLKFLNQRWYEYTGLQESESFGEGWMQVVHPNDVEPMLTEWHRSLLTKAPFKVEYRLRSAKDQIYRWHLGTALPIRDEHDQITKWVGSCTDIHEQRCAIEERANALERERSARMDQEKANRMKDEFLAMLSHELRSPLNPILGWTKLLRSRPYDPTMQERALETIERNAKLQSQLIEDLLDVSRILRGKLSLVFAPVSLQTTIEAAIETVRLTAEAKQLQIHRYIDPSVGKVLGDFNRLQQVTWNLLSNAVKFTPEGGSIEVAIEAVTEDGQPFAQLRVTDSGKGIAPDFLPFVFEQFRQAQGGTTREFGGLGLGLAIVRYLVEAHQGTIAVESAGENQGATFRVRLPLTIDCEGLRSTQPRDPISHQTLKGLKILMVDDEPDARQLLAFLLEQYGAIATVATSAAQTLAILRQESACFDVLISDLGMPEMDGYALIQMLRNDAQLVETVRDLPAIALTAYARDEDRDAALAAGFNGYVTKPIDPMELVKIVSWMAKRDRA